MIRDVYNFGESLLDPCCGSGNFLTEAVKHILSHNEPLESKITAINKIYGFDINPISIYVSKINLLYLLKENFSDNSFISSGVFREVPPLPPATKKP